MDWITAFFFWIGVVATVLCVVGGVVLGFNLILEWWVNYRDLRKAILGYYAEKLRQGRGARIPGN